MRKKKSILLPVAKRRSLQESLRELKHTGDKESSVSHISIQHFEQIYKIDDNTII